MTGVLLSLVLAGAVAAAVALLVPATRRALPLLGIALLLGLAGYAWQGSPGLTGSPTPPSAHRRGGDTLFAHERAVWLETVGPDAVQLDGADAFIRNGDADYAAGLLRAYLVREPGSMMLWLGLGNALQSYADGALTPAARFAFDRAAAVAPGHPGPPYFLGLAYLQMGDVAGAATTWQALLRQAPADAPWRGRLEARLELLHRIDGMRDGPLQSAVPK